MQPKQIDVVLPVSYNERNWEAVAQVLREVLLKLPIRSVTVVVEGGAACEAPARRAFDHCLPLFREAGVEIELLRVNAPDTGERWHQGLLHVRTRSGDLILVVPGDLRKGLENVRRAFDAACGSAAELVVIDYDSDDAFKTQFDEVVTLPILRCLNPSAAERLAALGCSKLRTELFAICPEFLDELEGDLRSGGLWPSDPTVWILVKATARAASNVEVVHLGHFGDDPDSRSHPSQRLQQIYRLVFQQLIIRLRDDLRRDPPLSDVRMDSATRLYQDAARLFGVAQHAADRTLEAAR
jgi:hypothetical protein